MNEAVLLKKLLQDLRPAKVYLIGGMALYVPVTILSVIQPLIIGYAVQHGMFNGTKETIAWFAFLFFVVVIILAGFELAQGLCLQITGQLLVANLRKRAFAKVQNLSMGFLDSTPMGRLLTRLTNDAESVVEMFSMGAVQIFGDCLFLLATFVMLFFVDVKLTLYSSIILPALGIGIYFFRLWTRKAFVYVREVLSSLNSFLQEYLSGMPTVQMSGQVLEAQSAFFVHNQKYLAANQRAIVLDAAIYSFVDALSYLAAALVLWGAFSQKQENQLSLGVLVLFLEALSRFFQPVRELSNRYAIFQSALVSLERMYEMFDWPEEKDLNGGSRRDFRHQVDFIKVSFSYRQEEPVLKNVSFTLKKGERLALVGPTGAGKSTVIKLLNRFYLPSKGSIVLDGEDINDMPLSETRRLISVVPQEVFLFHGTLRENLCFGNAHATDEELWNALYLVQLSDLIKTKGGLDARTLTKGQNFSLGERQLIALARALVTDPPILILDEATASIDAVTEKRLQVAIKEVLENRTALVIAHRLSTILDADRILVFHKGEIIEQGSHQTLMEQDGMYKSLIRLQEQGRTILSPSPQPSPARGRGSKNPTCN